MENNNINLGINNNLHIDTIIRKEKIYVEIRNKYLAEALAFLNFKYQKFGYGSETRYSFEQSKELQEATCKLMEMKKAINAR